MRDYRREARAGRVPFAVDELLAAGVDNDDLAARRRRPRLLKTISGDCTPGPRATSTWPRRRCRAQQRARQRHLLVLAALGRRHLNEERPPGRYRFKDMLLAWTTARRANRDGAAA